MKKYRQRLFVLTLFVLLVTSPAVWADMSAGIAASPDMELSADSSITLSAALVNDRGTLAVLLTAAVSGDAIPESWQRFNISGDMTRSGDLSTGTAIDTAIASGETYGYLATAVVSSDDTEISSDLVWLTATDAIGVTDISLRNIPAGNMVNLRPGGTFQISFTTTPAEATLPLAAYSSNNTKAATVSATGLVTAVRNGTAIITVTVTGLDGRKIVKTFTVRVGKGSHNYGTQSNDSEGCAAVGFGLLLLAALPFLRKKK